jgi:uridylate kinase
MIKATKVNGVYTADPKKDPDAVRFERLTYQQVLESRFEVMDMTAFTLCQENNMPILVLNLWHDDDLLRAVQGEYEVGTLINESGTMF